MRMAFRGTATATALALTWAAAVGCSSRGQRAHSAAEAAVAVSAAPSSPAPAASTAPGVSAKITLAAFNEDSDGARVVLSASAPLLYTSYEPRPDLLIVDLRDAGMADNFTAPHASGGLVESIRFEQLEELGKRLTRLSIAHRPEARADVRSVGQGLAIAFSGAPTIAAAEPENLPEPAPAGSASPAPPAQPVMTAPLAAAPASATARGEMAHVLEKVVAETRDGRVAITLIGDGWFSPKDFALQNPPRVVVDLPGIKNDVRQRTIAVKSDLVSRVRVSQFQTSPEFVTRVVVDLTRPMPHSIEPDGERLAVIVGPTETPREARNPTRDAPSTTTLASASEPPAPVASTSPPSPPPVTTETSEAATAVAPPAEAPTSTPSIPAIVEKTGPAPVEAPATAVSAPVETAPVPSSEAPHRDAVAERPAVKPAANPAQAASPASAPPEAHAVVAVATAKPAPVRTTAKAPKQPSSRGDALFEAAAAQLDQEQAARPEAGTAYRSRTIYETQTQFTGEPISLDLKDADIKDVFRTISQLTGLNIVIDPEVRGTVTVQLEDVPWDQALDLILKQNSLGYVLENNIMRIATTAKLQAEEGDRARLAEARQAAEPTRTVIKKLSYAKAGEITPTLQSVMSKRGSIVIDARTNTLIIREIPTYLPAVLQLIENLDTATPQVVIESRIVETTKSLGRSLGINWSVNGVADVAHGNTTNLIFPNSVSGGLNIGLGNGPTVASLVLGNILNTFNLDIALTAAENQGLLKIISSPKVTSLTNTPALIQSGVQIPVQTTVNNTTTVIYVDATLKLDVTPQITAEGTIMLTVNVSKREPAVALNLSLGQNVPLTIREYRGQVLVKDGGTTVIGGIFQINDQDQNNMIPGLWKIPVLGNLFRNKTRTEKHDELLIFITPRILRS
ncbi:MAG TPA: type IV pilus secretin PilQ [Thermoanaerobaculia bacterium]